MKIQCSQFRFIWNQSLIKRNTSLWTRIVFWYFVAHKESGNCSYSSFSVFPVYFTSKRRIHAIYQSLYSVRKHHLSSRIRALVEYNRVLARTTVDKTQRNKFYPWTTKEIIDKIREERTLQVWKISDNKVLSLTRKIYLYTEKYRY